MGVLTDSLYFPGYWGVKNDGDSYPHNPAKTMEILNKLNYKDPDGDGILEDGEENKLSLEILINEGNESRKLASEQIAEDLGKAGFEVTIRQEPQDVYLRSLQSLNYDIYLGGAKMGENYDLGSLLRSYSGNPAGFVNPEVDGILDVLRSMKDSDAKLAAYKKLNRCFRRNFPTIRWSIKPMVSSLPGFPGNRSALVFPYLSGSGYLELSEGFAGEDAPEQEGEKSEENPG
jgi:peptide/nickel transport system substrate-binding protein